MDADALLLSGGEIAEYFLKTARVKSMVLVEEPLPGIVSARAEAWWGKTLWIVTKSGSFSNERALFELIEYLLKIKVNTYTPSCKDAI